jgi:hypothetical protein
LVAARLLNAGAVKGREPVRFLEGNFGGMSERSIIISIGKTTFFPLGNYRLGYDELKTQPLDEWLG